MSKYILPPIQNLVAFEAAARLASFSLAANELCLTPPAITHQIKQLETFLNLSLFARSHKGVTLTTVGKQFYQELEPILNHFNSLTLKYHENCVVRNTLTVAVTPTFSKRCLVDKLPIFLQQYPAINLKIKHAVRPVNVADGQTDMAIRWGRGNWDNLICEHLLSGNKQPILSPVLANKIALQSPLDLCQSTLLHEDNHQDWKKWFAQHNLYPEKVSEGPVIDDAEVLLTMVIEGQGIALGRISTLEKEIQTKKLIVPFKQSLPSSNSYWLVYPELLKKQVQAMQFRSFLLAIFT